MLIYRGTGIVLVAVAAWTGVPAGAAAAGPAPLELFGDEVDDPGALAEKEPHETARRVLEVNWRALAAMCPFGSRERSRPLRLRLFPGRVVTAVPELVSRGIIRNHVLNWSGTAEGPPSARVRIIASGVCGRSPATWMLSGSVRRGTQEYRISPWGDQALVAEVDTSQAVGFLPAPR